MRVVVDDGLVAGLYALRAPKKPEEPGVLHTLHIGNPVAAVDLGLVAIIGEMQHEKSSHSS